MHSCWLLLPNKRPTFEELKQAITTLLESISGYMDFTEGAPGNIQSSGYDNLNRYNNLNRYDKLEQLTEK